MARGRRRVSFLLLTWAALAVSWIGYWLSNTWFLALVSLFFLDRLQKVCEACRSHAAGFGLMWFGMLAILSLPPILLLLAGLAAKRNLSHQLAS
ncbi:MAG: hypothetical protein KGJ78_02860 [Alphaproteobacteria bacterium]|nr:hypothetical protein [Alphaproteobacteria bacterium]